MGLEELFGRIEKRFGKEAVVGNDIKVDTVSSGSMALDEILGGGFALGRIHEIYGGFSSGKSSAALHLSASIQKLRRSYYIFYTQRIAAFQHFVQQ
jgi:recombination protein RecA